MKLYYAPGTCSLAPQIIAAEAGISLALERVDIGRTPHLTESGVPFRTINPKGYVPALQLEDGTLLTEGAAILQYLGDLKPEAALVPPAGSRQRLELQVWLNFIATELHKMFSPWLFHPEYGPKAQVGARAKIVERLSFVEDQLTDGRAFLLGQGFTAADAYLFTIVRWSSFGGVDLDAFPRVRALMTRIAERPAVQEALRAEESVRAQPQLAQ